MDLHDELMCLESLSPMLMSLRDARIIDRAMERRMMRSEKKDGDVNALLMALETRLTYSPESLDKIVEAVKQLDTLKDLAERIECAGMSTGVEEPWE